MTMILVALLAPWRYFCDLTNAQAEILLTLCLANDAVWLTVVVVSIRRKLDQKRETMKDAPAPMETPSPRAVPLNWLEIYCKRSEKVEKL